MRRHHLYARLVCVPAASAAALFSIPGAAFHSLSPSAQASFCCPTAAAAADSEREPRCRSPARCTGLSQLPVWTPLSSAFAVRLLARSHPQCFLSLQSMKKSELATILFESCYLNDRLCDKLLDAQPARAIASHHSGHCLGAASHTVALLDVEHDPCAGAAAAGGAPSPLQCLSSAACRY